MKTVTGDSNDVEPSACGWCGVPEREHMQRWTKGAGWHVWTEPTQEQRKVRMIERTPLTRPVEPCQPIYVHAYGMDRETWEKLFNRVADAAHALDEEVSCSGGNECALCADGPDC